MKVIITAATQMEWQPLHDLVMADQELINKPLQVKFETTGIGVMASTFSLCNIISREKPDLLLQIGIAGAFTKELSLGEVVVVQRDCPGDLLVEENEILLDLFDLGLNDRNEFPFVNSLLNNLWLPKLKLNVKQVSAVTVSEITTRKKRILQLQEKYGAKIETMEGAALHYVCLQMNVPFLQVKAVSNYVGERDKNKWEIRKAISNLSAVVLEFLKVNEQKYQLKSTE